MATMAPLSDIATAMKMALMTCIMCSKVALVSAAFSSSSNHLAGNTYRIPRHRIHVPPKLQSSASIPLPSSSSTQLSLTRYDNLVSGIAEISIGFSLGVLFSEYAVITTGCGPLSFSDTLERICYQGVILSAGASLFTRIVTGGNSDLTIFVCEDYFGGDMLAESTVVQVRVAESLSILAVLGAIVALSFQVTNGERMDGLSGINVEMCRAVRDL
jgi:hypothetical protein